MIVVVGSENPVKIKAVEEAFSIYFKDVKVIGVKVDSKVGSQPFGEDTFRGARNRALELKGKLDGDFFVGLEGGIIKFLDKWFTFGVVCSIDKNGREGIAATSMFELPSVVIKNVLSGRELGDVMDELSGERDTKRKGGAVGYFTNNFLTRKDLFVRATVLSLVPFLNKEFEK